ncbi:putative RNA-binding protein 27 [Trypanosoma cruzi]|uniref:RNA-binding protein 27 n=2 Tax=Trypanosoma cruzi TaxID=5693 RepID=Q4E1U9_TRYCC|nr:hypothetical protein, conserved [Trypanosoma cruzi]EAN98771.1 hypothetical protein, conserved [Trypanosoma cruzi]KAF5225877.1 hypothetical protein ECC02_001196 [Trypanosoma cruzi]KAF8292803.1 putative RNA-binding protein 27 [Trypanosoma cruzi]PWV21520.1 putative RNA-binding protein 27 [Trypanosoma cruzi]|eukprot:XP_820622.1 hypothetical protein [Trypanosoma cruzi strain CL Brener]
MATREDARVVHVFVEDPSVVLIEDVHDWLRIIDDVEEAKEQYDTARRCRFYWLRFKHGFAAQLAVNYLDGEKLKNNVVRIFSSVYTKRTPVEADAEDTTHPEGEKEEQQAVENPNLPFNHRMPSDLRMDTPLVDSIPTLLSAAAEGSEQHDLVQQLCQLQKSYCQVQEMIQAAELNIQKADEEVMQLLRGNDKSSGSVVNGINDKAEDDRSPELRRSRRLANTVQIPMTLLDPASLIVKFTRHIGPVTDYSFSVSPDGHFFRTVVEFFHEDDVIYALQILNGGGSSKAATHSTKRTRLECDAEEALSPLSVYNWGEDASADLLRPPDLSLFYNPAHIQAMNVLQSCLN